MRDIFDDLMDGTAEGYGYWPDPDGVLCWAKGTTMKQMRSWAIWHDNRR